MASPGKNNGLQRIELRVQVPLVFQVFKEPFSKSPWDITLCQKSVYVFFSCDRMSLQYSFISCLQC